MNMYIITEVRTTLLRESRGAVDSCLPAEPANYPWAFQQELVLTIEATALHSGQSKLDIYSDTRNTRLVVYMEEFNIIRTIHDFKPPVH
jgi:hypothetical protein